MAKRVVPKTSGDNLSAVQLMNLIRNNASAEYQSLVPLADETDESARSIGTVFRNYPSILGEYLKYMWTMCVSQRVFYREYHSPFGGAFYKGKLEVGETLQDIFVELCKAHEYDPEDAETSVWKREAPDVRSIFYPLNYRKYYKQTIQETDIDLYFTSWSGVSRLTDIITARMYNSAEYDEYQTTLYLIGRSLLDGNMLTAQSPAKTTEGYEPSDLTEAIVAVSDDMTLMGTKYNIAKVHNHTPKEDQFILGTPKFWASQNVKVLAQAYNMDRAEFSGHHITVNSFADLDTERLNALFVKDPGYKEIGSSDLESLAKCDCFILDREWLQFYYKYNKFVTDPYNGDGLYYSMKYHVGRVFGVSPFANAVAMVEGVPTVTSVTVSPKSLVMSGGTSAKITATVKTTNFAPQTVSWSITDGEEYATITRDGTVTVLPTAPASTSITVTATSTFDTSKKDTCTITTPSA